MQPLRRFFKQPARDQHRVVFGGLFIAAGLLHFVQPQFYTRIMPPFLPAPRTLVYVSGGLEALAGVGLLVPRSKRLAGWGVIGLLLAFLPVHVYMLIAPEEVAASDIPAPALWLRLVFQFVLMGWVRWAVGGRRR